MIGELLVRCARQTPDAIALAAPDRQLAYRELPEAVAATAASISTASPGDRPIGIALPNGLDWVLADLALAALGRASVPLPSFFLPPQAEAALADAGASAVIEPGGIRLLDGAPVALPPGTAKISYTSGSTGTPKGICLAEAQLLATAGAIVDRFGKERAGRHLPLLPLGVLLENVAGLYASLIAGGCFLAEDGAALGLAKPFQPDVPALAAAVTRLGATSLIMVPELLQGLVAHLEATGLRLPSLTLVAVGGAPVPPGLLDRAAATDLPVLQGYGLTECGSVVSIEAPGEAVRGSVGRPLDHVTVRIAADGEIMIDGNGHLGTVGDARAPGTIATGDIGWIDHAGRLNVAGRRSNLIITGFGRNISPEWIEGALIAQPEIAQALVHGEGEADLSALIVPAGPAINPSPAIAWVNASLPDYARIGGWELSHPFVPTDGTLTPNGRLRRDRILARQAALPFFERLKLSTAEARGRLMAVPQLQAGLHGRIGRATYLAYLTQAYHHVRHTVPLMEAARALLTGRSELVAALDEYIADELGHDQWILDDIAAAGGDPAAAAREAPSRATSKMVAHAYLTIGQCNPVAIFGMVFVLEGTSIAIAREGAAAVQQSLGLPPEAFRYLTSHGALDEDHMAFLERLLNGLEDPRDRQAVTAMANDIFDLFAGVFAGIAMDETHEFA